jgi:PhnB protein
MPDDSGPQQRPEARVMMGVIPYLAMGGKAGEAAEFYGRAFAATDLGRMPMDGQPGRFMHVQVEINGGALMMTDHSMSSATDAPPMASGHLQLVVGGGKMWFDRAVAAGCTVLEPFARQFWGDDWGLLQDPFGIKWAVLSPAEEGAP